MFKVASLKCPLLLHWIGYFSWLNLQVSDCMVFMLELTYADPVEVILSPTYDLEESQVPINIEQTPAHFLLNVSLSLNLAG